MHNANHPDTVVGFGADRPGNVGAVPSLVHRIAIVAVKIVAIDVVHKAVSVIVDAIPGYFPRIGPHIAGEVRVVVLHALVDDRNKLVGITGLRGPGLYNIHISIRNA